ncbi:MAG: arginine--tRNA ligase [Planctomycetales bacterium]
MNFQSELRRRFAAALAPLTSTPDTFAAMVKPAQDPKFGDYQANCAMPLGKQLGKSPRDVAADLLARIDLSDLCETPEIAGPGFINLKLREDVLLRTTEGLLRDDRLGVPPVTPRRYIVDFSSPNVAKPMHVGHLRSTVIGESLSRMLRFLGHEVTADNHVGDWGTQFGMIIYGYKHFLDQDHFQQDMVGELARLYRLVNQLSDYFDTREKLPQLDQALADKLHKLAAPADTKTDPKLLEKQPQKLTQEVEIHPRARSPPPARKWIRSITTRYFPAISSSIPRSPSMPAWKPPSSTPAIPKTASSGKSSSLPACRPFRGSTPASISTSTSPSAKATSTHARRRRPRPGAERARPRKRRRHLRLHPRQ